MQVVLVVAVTVRLQGSFTCGASGSSNSKTTGVLHVWLVQVVLVVAVTVRLQGSLTCGTSGSSNSKTTGVLHVWY